MGKIKFAGLYPTENAYSGLKRDNWWEPYSWNRTGIGMSVIFNEDCSDAYDVRGRKLENIKLYGLKAEKDFLTTRACLEFDDFYLLFDRALHNPGRMQIENSETGEPKKVSGIPYIAISKESKSYNPNPIGRSFPVSGAEALETLVVGCRGKMISKLILRGNKTMAVGLLTNKALIELGGQHLFIATACLGKDYLSKLFGEDSGLNKLYVLITEGSF